MCCHIAVSHRLCVARKLFASQRVWFAPHRRVDPAPQVRYRVDMLDERGRLLLVALGFAGLSVPSYDRALHGLRTWLDSWAGIGRVAIGLARQGYDLQLT